VHQYVHLPGTDIPHASLRNEFHQVFYHPVTSQFEILLQVFPVSFWVWYLGLLPLILQSLQ